jgi:hypothetical protein
MYAIVNCISTGDYTGPECSAVHTRKTIEEATALALQMCREQLVEIDEEDFNEKGPSKRVMNACKKELEKNLSFYGSDEQNNTGWSVSIHTIISSK